MPKFETNKTLGTFNFNIDNIDLSNVNSENKMKLKTEKENSRISNFDVDGQYDELAGNVKEEIKSPLKLSPKKSSILQFMERKLSGEDAFFSLNK
jgi:hypothetical protein